MTPENEWTTGRINDLAAQVRTVASVVTLVATHDVKIDAHSEDILALRENQREAVKEFRDTLVAFDKACEKKVERLEAAIGTRRWSPMAIVGLVAAITSPAGVALAAVLDKV